MEYNMTDANTDIELAPRTSVTDVANAIEGLNSGAAFFSTVKGTDMATRRLVTKALTSSLPIKEHINKPIKLAHIVVQPVELADEKTGEVTVQPRVVLLDHEGNAFHGTSLGLLSSVRNILAGMGDPSEWDGPLDIKVVEQKSSNNAGHFFTVKLV
jgi:hypothetical protein